MLGKDLIVADMLSQAPTSAPMSADQQFHHKGNAFVIQGLPASDQQLETIKDLIVADTLSRAPTSAPMSANQPFHCKGMLSSFRVCLHLINSWKLSKRNNSRTKCARKSKVIMRKAGSTRSSKTILPYVKRNLSTRRIIAHVWEQNNHPSFYKTEYS